MLNKNIFKKNKKKGAIMVEFLVVLPFYIFTLWMVMQMMIMMISFNTINQTSIEGARILAQNLRGYEGSFSTSNLQKAGLTEAALQNIVSTKMASASSYNAYLLLFRDENGGTRDIQPKIGMNKQECLNQINGHVTTICIWSDDTNKAGQEQVGVVAKSKFLIIGNFIPGLQDRAYVKGVGISHKNLTNRFNYYEDDQQLGG